MQPFKIKRRRLPRPKRRKRMISLLADTDKVLVSQAKGAKMPVSKWLGILITDFEAKGAER